MSKSHELAWAAGFFDGEGWVKIQRRGGKEYLGFYLRLGINHVNPEPLHKMQQLFGGKVRKDKKVCGNRKIRHVWTLSTKEAKSAIICMLPYLINKKEVATLGLEFSDTVQTDKKKLPDETQLYRYVLAERIKHLNSLD